MVKMNEMYHMELLTDKACKLIVLRALYLGKTKLKFIITKRNININLIGKQCMMHVRSHTHVDHNKKDLFPSVGVRDGRVVSTNGSLSSEVNSVPNCMSLRLIYHIFT